MQSTKQPSVEASMEDVFSAKKCKHDLHYHEFK